MDAPEATGRQYLEIGGKRRHVRHKMDHMRLREMYVEEGKGKLTGKVENTQVLEMVCRGTRERHEVKEKVRK